MMENDLRGAFSGRKEGNYEPQRIEVRGKLPGCLCGQQSMRMLEKSGGLGSTGALLFPGGDNVESRGPTKMHLQDNLFKAQLKA